MPKNQSLPPHANWRWWVALVPASIVIIAAGVFTAGKVIGYFSEWAFVALHQHILRPLVVWTWGDKP